MKRALLTSACAFLAIASAQAQESSPAQTPEQDNGLPSSPADPNAAIIAKANSDKAVAEASAAASTAQKTAYEAEKAATEAKAAAAAAKNGSVTGSTYATGAVTVGEDGPQAEATLLVAKAIEDAAWLASDQMVNAVAAVKDKRILVATSPAEASTMQLAIFEVQVDRLVKALRLADVELAAALGQAQLCRLPADESAKRSFLAAASGVDAALGAISKLGTYFQSDYNYDTVTLPQLPDLFAGALVSALRAKGFDQAVVAAPGDLTPNPALIVPTLQMLDDSVQRANRQIAVATTLAAVCNANAEKDAKQSATLAGIAQRLSAGAGATKTILDSAGALSTTLFAATEDKAAPIAQILQQARVREYLRQGAVVLLVTGKPTAAYYTQKNLWTFLLPGMPLYTMGGAILSYRLYDPVGGQTYAWGNIAQHSGYSSVANVERRFTKPKPGQRTQP